MLTTTPILQAHGMRVFDVEELTTHGDSLRVYACRAEDQARDVESSVRNVIAEKESAELAAAEGYHTFGQQVKKTKLAMVDFLLTAARRGKSVAATGRRARVRPCCIYCGIANDLIEYTVDRSPYNRGDSCRAHTSRSIARAGFRDQTGSSSCLGT